MEKCLFVSDLDGTLLRSDETLSEYTCNVINRLTKEGMIFSYATARSLITAKKVTSGLNAFLKTREGDQRWREVLSEEDLLSGDLFYITCIDAKDKLEPFYEKYKDTYHIVFQQDIYTKEHWLETFRKTRANGKYSNLFLGQ